MKTSLYRMAVLAAVLLMTVQDACLAQTFRTLFDFAQYNTNSSGDTTNSTGVGPVGGVVLSAGILYGTAFSGGTNGAGTVFAVNTNGTGYTNLHAFAAESYNSSYYSTNSDGAGPVAGLILSGSTLYGTTASGGMNGAGTVFAVNTNGMAFSNLHAFAAENYDANYNSTNSDGGDPVGGVILSGNTLYGTAGEGGPNGSGAVFAVNTSGAPFTNLYSFTALISTTNRDGAHPDAQFVLLGNTLFGTSKSGGSSSNGTIFRINTDGTDFTNLYSFTAGRANSSGILTNGDGADPIAGLIFSGNYLYGTAYQGGVFGNGTVFAVTTNGTGFANLHSFTAVSILNSTNSDGAQPISRLTLSGSVLYGTATAGGASTNGTVFAINTNGSGFLMLHSFSACAANSLGHQTNSDGAFPAGGLVLSGNTLYGTTTIAGTNGSGTVFSLSLAPVASVPQLAIVRSGTNMIVTWLTNFTGYTLEYATNLVSSALWSSNLPVPVTVKAQFVVTNGISSTRKFYRLIE